MSQVYKKIILDSNFNAAVTDKISLCHEIFPIWHTHKNRKKIDQFLQSYNFYETDM